MTTEKPLWETKPDGKIGPTAEGERVWDGRRALDLDAIKAQYARTEETISAVGSSYIKVIAELTTTSLYVPALVAEVERQAKILRIVRGLAEAIMFDSDAEPARTAILAALDSNQPAASRTSDLGSTGEQL
jgi:hypothetical protein